MGLKITIALLIGLAVAVAGVFVGVQRLLLARRASRWAIARGQVLEATLVRADDGDGHVLDVRYEFEVRGHRIEGNTPRLVGDFFLSDKSRADYLKRFRKGANVRVYHDPDNPGESCLDRSAGGAIVILASALVLVPTTLLLLWRYSKPFRYWMGLDPL